jgi:hypothetical protein
MFMDRFPFGITEWSKLPATVLAGQTGTATHRTHEFGELRVRMVEYSPGYLADHWCSKGHILLVVSGSLTTELADGRIMTLPPGTSYQVGDDGEAHRSSTTDGARLFIVDGG